MRSMHRGRPVNTGLSGNAMLNFFVAATLIALSFSFARNADAFIDPPYLTPERPTAGEVVAVNIRSGGCDAILGIPGYPEVTQEIHSIRIVVWSASYTDPILCYYTPGISTYAVGAYPPDSYTLQVDREYFGDLGGIQTETLGVIPFTVSGPTAQPAALPALNSIGSGVLILALAGGVVRRRGHVTARILLAAALAPLAPSGHAQTASPDSTPANHLVELLVTTAPGAPTPDQIIAYFESPTGAPPLQALRVENPTSAEFLLGQRAAGDFLRRLQEHPDSVRAKLERYLLVVYPDGADLERAVSALRADPYVAAAQEPVPMEFSSVDLADFQVDDAQDNQEIYTQYGRDALNIDAAWALSGGGYALVADIDSGAYVNSPWLRQFAGSQYVAGNFIPVASLDVSGRGLKVPIPDDPNVDERRAVLISDPSCSPGGPSTMAPVLAGHGTHTAGLIAANGSAGPGVQGTCKKCGIAMWKVAYAACHAGQVVPNYNPAANAVALAYVGDIGAQVANMSFGADRIPNYCASLNPNAPPEDTAMCLAIAHNALRDVAMVGASGNQRKRVQFPANDDRVIAAGGFQSDLALWDDSPGNNVHCPYPTGAECGSNFTTPANGARQELVGAAKSILSTTYPGFDWNVQVKCGDSFGPGGGTGLCTGTSMSAPQISGVVGLMRSINPLVPVGKPTFNPLSGKASLRSVIASTTAEAQANHAWTPTMGYGRPDAAAAARKMLGKVAGVYIRNRVTPLFRLHSASGDDYADTTSPQTAVALMINSTYAWQPVASLPAVPNYPSFPHDPADGALAAPRASVYVMTTAISPRAEWPALVPLYLMDKAFAGRRDFMLVTTTADIEQAHASGYNLRTIQAYIYKPCTPEPACIPPSAQKFWRKCKAVDNDCATFLEEERGGFESAGYTTTYPAGSNARLGYAYPATDTDHDGLPDGFEQVVGTSPAKKNSDNDTSDDGVEFPMVGVPVSDPCGGVGSSGAQFCLADWIFRNGFDPS
jgi:hypothetical protein